MLIKMETSGGGGGASAPELVWANPSLPNLANTTFAAQTLNESSSGWVSGKHVADYDGFIVLTHYTAENVSSSSTRGETFTYIPASTPTFAPTYNNHAWGVAANNTTTAGSSRTFEVNNGIVIGAGTGGNNFCLPMYIWGVKGSLSNS